MFQGYCNTDVPKISRMFLQNDDGEIMELKLENKSESPTFKDYSLKEKAKRGIKNQYFALIRLLGFIFVLSIFFASCKKCADCTTTVTIKTGGQPPQTASSTEEMCGDDLKEADGHTTTSTSTVGMITSTITSKTECD